MPLYAAGSPRLVAPKGVECAEEKSYDGAKSNKRVHVGRTVEQLSPCRHIELSTAPIDVYKSYNKTNLVGEGYVAAC